MNTKTKWRVAFMPVALAALAIVPLQGCDEVTNAQQSLCCSEFTPGADLAAVDWKLEGQAGLNFGAFMQATSDFTGAATAMVGDVANACQAIAVDLGAEPRAVTATEPDKRATEWCNLAVSKIKEVGAQLTISFQPPSCTINASVQASCEGKCSANVECEITPAQIVARCDPGKLSGRCTAQCTGTCEGSANLAVACEGKCGGTCEGQCMGNCAVKDAMGNCRGACDGTCQGECRGSCDVDANAMVQCNADCTGGCSVEYEAPKCKAELSPPSAECQADVDCNASCKASASAKAECREPSLVIEGSTNADKLIATLQVNLPKLLTIAQARGQLLVDNAQVVVQASGSIEIGGSVKATACLIPAAAAIGQALKNAEASLTASVSVVGSVGIN